jgi:creatinine amidohydrolase
MDTFGRSPRRIELSRPGEIRALLAERPVAYLPLGTLEWHAEHLPIGLDALTAHGVCLAAASRDGGVVLPPLYFGTGGGHGGYPWTITMPDGSEMAALIDRTLDRLAELGVRLAVLFTGHFPDEQIAVVEAAAARRNALGGPLAALALSLNRVQGIDIEPDHSGVFETTLLHALLPDRVDLGQLPQRVAGEPPDDPLGPGRHDPGHPLWGVVGLDPRDFDPARGPALLDACAAWVAGEARARLP